MILSPTPPERITDAERSGSLIGLGILFGVSLILASQWVTRGEDWTPLEAPALMLFGIGIGLQVWSLRALLRLPRATIDAHDLATKRAMAGIVIVLMGVVATIVVDVGCARHSGESNPAFPWMYCPVQFDDETFDSINAGRALPSPATSAQARVEQATRRP